MVFKAKQANGYVVGAGHDDSERKFYLHKIQSWKLAACSDPRFKRR